MIGLCAPRHGDILHAVARSFGAGASWWVYCRPPGAHTSFLASFALPLAFLGNRHQAVYRSQRVLHQIGERLDIIRLQRAAQHVVDHHKVVAFIESDALGLRFVNRIRPRCTLEIDLKYKLYKK